MPKMVSPLIILILVVLITNAASSFICFGYLSNDTQNVCSGRGSCIGTNICQACSGGYAGHMCQNPGCYSKTPPQVNATLFGFGSDFGNAPNLNNGLIIDTSVKLFSSGRFHTIWSNSSGNIYSLGCFTLDVILKNSY
jgi:hypothetical protein